MYTTILWATDGSHEAGLALTEALELLEPGGRLVAFHCDQRFSGSRVGGAPVLADESDRRATILEQVHELKARGIDAELVVDTTRHSPAREIVAAAETEGAEAIVCGTRGFGTVRRMLEGTIAGELLHRSHLPVIVVPARASVRRPSSTRRIYPNATTGHRSSNHEFVG